MTVQTMTLMGLRLHTMPPAVSGDFRDGWSIRSIVIDDLQAAGLPLESRTPSAASLARWCSRGPQPAGNALESNPSPNFEFAEGSRRRLDIALRGTSAGRQWLVVPPWSARRECTTRGAGRSRPDFQPMDPG